MAIGTWDPNQNKQQDKDLLSNEFLERAIKASADNRLEHLEQDFDSAEQRELSAVMHQTEEQWLLAVNSFSSENIHHLMRFLTVAEMTFADWEVGAKSPVIWLNKCLKTRGDALNREQVLWIKSNTRNRYLPNGAVLL
ncbi:MAG: hypothetical protein AB8B48_08435 [Pseudomonadales bacterium]